MIGTFLLSRCTVRRVLSFKILVPLILSLLAGCGPSGTLSNMWRDPSFQSGPMKNVLIIAVRKDPVHRRTWEDGFVTELGKHGVSATPSYRLFPDALPDTAQCIEAIRSNGYDGVLVTRRLGVDTVARYVPGYSKDTMITRYNRWTDSYFTSYRIVEVPGYTETERTARHEVNIWTTKDGGRLVWAGTGGIMDPTSGQSINQEIAGLIVPELANTGIIPPEK